jgi:pyruvate,water dikinase
VATKITINFGDPDIAEETARIPNDGAGPCPVETIIRRIGAHPMALLHPEKIRDPDERKRVQGLSTDGGAYFIEQLAAGMAALATAFHPKPVIVRLSDFQSDEYAMLHGGRDFEPHEQNPMIAWRGAVRYTHPDYAEAFALECAAVKRVREDMGLTNLHPLVPYCRRLSEAHAVIEAMAANGLRQTVDGLQIHLMAEVPNNAMEIDGLADLFDGISIGSRDLTQLILGIDAGAAFVSAADFDPCNPGVLRCIQMLIEGAKRHDCPISICGPTPSERPEMAEFVVRHGIDCLSLRPDSVVETTRNVRQLEQDLSKR